MCSVLSSFIHLRSAIRLFISFLLNSKNDGRVDINGRKAFGIAALAFVVVALIIPAVNETQIAYASTTWNIGDVFAGINGGSYNIYDSQGNFKETINIGGSHAGTGCSFNPSGDKLYTTNFETAKVVVFADASPHNVVQTIDTGATSPGGGSESVVFDSAGNFYVGQATGNRLVQKYDAAGNLLKTFNVKIDRNGSDWVELSSDQRTLFYTSEGGKILRYDVQNDVQLDDFADVGDHSFALRLLPPWDGSGGLLVSSTADIKRLNSNGQVVQTYDAPGQDTWRSINLDPNGTSFWSGTSDTGNLYRFNINTGAIEVGAIPTGKPGEFVPGGICIKGEKSAGTQVSRPSTGGLNCKGVDEARFDIVPGNRDNTIHLGSSGHVATAIFSNSDFDAPNCVKTSSLTFGHSGDEKSLHDCGAVDVNDDGFVDLYCEFVIADTHFQIGDVEGIIKGDSILGSSFKFKDKVTVIPTRRGVQILGLDDVRALQIGQSYYFVANGENISSIELQIFDMTGRRVFESATTNGTHLRVSLRGTDTRLVNGIYFYRVTVHSIDGQTIHGKIKMMLVLR